MGENILVWPENKLGDEEAEVGQATQGNWGSSNGKKLLEISLSGTPNKEPSMSKEGPSFVPSPYLACIPPSPSNLDPTPNTTKVLSLSVKVAPDFVTLTKESSCSPRLVLISQIPAGQGLIMGGLQSYSSDGNWDSEKDTQPQKSGFLIVSLIFLEVIKDDANLQMPSEHLASTEARADFAAAHLSSVTRNPRFVSVSPSLHL